MLLHVEVAIWNGPWGPKMANGTAMKKRYLNSILWDEWCDESHIFLILLEYTLTLVYARLFLYYQHKIRKYHNKHGGVWSQEGKQKRRSRQWKAGFQEERKTQSKTTTIQCQWIFWQVLLLHWQRRAWNVCENHREIGSVQKYTFQEWVRC